MTRQNESVEDLTEPPVAIVTGATSGIGLAAATELARRGWTLAIVGRDRDRLAAALSETRAAAARATAAAGNGRHPTTISGFLADFARLDTVRALAEQLLSAYPRISVLANNAGGAIPERRITVDGHELTMQLNHLAPFLLSNLLRTRLAGGRIIGTASMAHRFGTLDPTDLSGTRARFSSLPTYATAKQASILATAEAARRWPEIASTCYHPGGVRTRFGHERALYRLGFRYAPGLRSPERGARTLVWLATTDDPVPNGGYFKDERVRRPAPNARDPRLAAELWQASLRTVHLDA